jgi:hypothetical protein
MVEFCITTLDAFVTNQTHFFAKHGLHLEFNLHDVNNVMNFATKD